MKIGPYEVKVTQRPNCRRMILRHHRTDGTFSLSVPRGARTKDITAFLTANLRWMERQAGQAAPVQPAFAAGEQHCLLGRWVTLGRDVPAGAAYLRHREAVLRRVILTLLQKWAPVMRVTVTHVTLREMTSRWGSCRPKTGRLTFNLHLASYPERIIEETVVHELCHFFHADHSAAFYGEMDRYLPDWRIRKAERTGMDVRPRLPGKP